jgi:RNA polymerase sigma-70 factor (ECF subfamily)
MIGTARTAHPTTVYAPAAPADTVLVRQAQLDRRAFAPLYDRYFDASFRFCFHRVGDWQDAEDAAVERDDGFRCWLFVIARRVVANRHRHRVRHPDQSLAAATDLLDAAPTPEDLALDADDHRLVATLRTRLEPDERDLLELRLAGLNDAEIAGVLGRSHGAVRQDQSRTIRKLRTLLGTGDRKEAIHA